ncbi:MAG: hypothetical protein KF767_14045 [Bdellovibrionaceae bacterium]|nr:hypothetical protein [Pseudobdellovibrionaceae bacterium]
MGIQGLILSVVLVAVGFPAFANTSSAKKTVCTITINSNQEKELFRKKLPADKFRIVELIPESAPGLAWIEGWAGANWFKKACEKRVQCDVLVISGHFAGTFFGKSGQSLSLNEMEKASCQSACDGIFKRPKEVYLFGCNTLADKSLDHRRPEDYVEVLRADGFSVEEAHSIALQRYTPWGSSNMDRMRSLFPNAAGLYGFHSTSPLGKYIEAPLAKYLDGRAATYAQELDTMKMGDRNTKLAEALKMFSFRQADAAGAAAQPLVCRMSVKADSNGEMAKDLGLISATLHSEEPLRDLPQVLERLRHYEERGGAPFRAWRDSETGIVEKLRSMLGAKELQNHFVVRLGLLELLQILSGAQSVAVDYRDLMESTLKSLNGHRAQEICAQRGSGLIASQRLPSEWVERFASAANAKSRDTVFGALSCLNFATDPAWLKKGYPASFLHAQNWGDSKEALTRLLVAKPGTQNLDILLPLLTEQPMSPDVQSALAAYFKRPASTIALLKAARSARLLTDEAKLAIIDMTRIGGDDELKGEWIQFWRAQKPSSELVQRALFDHARREDDPSSWLAVFGGVELHASVRAHLVSLIEKPGELGRRFILNLLSRLTNEGEGLYGLAFAMTKDADAGLRTEAVDVLSRHFFEAIDPSLEPRMLELLRNDTDENVLERTLRFWAKRGTRDAAVLAAIDNVWVRGDEYGDVRRTASDVLAHLGTLNATMDAAMIDAWWGRLMKAPKDGEAEAQLLQMLAAGTWKTHARRDQLVTRFQRDLRSEDSRRRVFAQKAILRNGNPDATFLERSARELETAVRDQNWMGARELGYELEKFRSHPRVAKALRVFETELESSLGTEL